MNDTSLLNPDGTNFKPSETVEKYIVFNETINMFINSDQDSSKVILVGQKGSGKSILIHYKSFKDRKDTNDKDLNRFFIPEEGVETILFSDQLSASDIAKNVKFENWEKIFTVTFYYFILAKLKNQLIKLDILTEKQFDALEFHDKFNPGGYDCTALSFGSILERAIRNRNILYKNQGDFISNSRHILKIFLRSKELSVYFDNLDQTLFSALKSDKGNILENDNIGDLKNELPESAINLDNFVNSSAYLFSNNSVSSWLHAHIGYYLALYKINELDRKFNVYSTFRLEAFEYLNHLDIKNKPQYRGIACKMNYSKIDFENIYKKLLQVADIKNEDLSKLSLKDLPHSWVQNSLHNSESLWNYIRRHTFGNPREITYQIGVLKDTIPKLNVETQNDVERVFEFKKDMAAEALKNIFRDLKAETMPVFPTKKFLEFYKSHKRNWLTFQELNDDNRSLIVILYRLGLVGVVKSDGKRYEQSFLDKNVYYSNQSVSLPESDYYLFHPTLDHILLNNFPKEDFYYPYCIIGDKMEFHYLREMEYYLPKDLHKDGMVQYNHFYELKDQFEKYNAIQNKCIDKWFSIIWDHVFNIRNDDWIAKFGKFINDDKLEIHGLRKSNREQNVRGLIMNYQLRVVITFARLTGLVQSNISLKDSFLKVEFYLVTYFKNIRADKGNLEQFLKQLSDFEINILEMGLNQPKFSEDLTKKMKSDYQFKKRVEYKINSVKQHLQNYK